MTLAAAEVSHYIWRKITQSGFFSPIPYLNISGCDGALPSDLLSCETVDAIEALSMFAASSRLCSCLCSNSHIFIPLLKTFYQRVRKSKLFFHLAGGGAGWAIAGAGVPPGIRLEKNIYQGFKVKNKHDFL